MEEHICFLLQDMTLGFVGRSPPLPWPRWSALSVIFKVVGSVFLYRAPLRSKITAQNILHSEHSKYIENTQNTYACSNVFKILSILNILGKPQKIDFN